MYNILVVFNDDSEKMFDDVINYVFNKDGYCYIEKNDSNKENITMKSFIKTDNIKYFGPVEFWEDAKSSKLVCCKDCEYFNENPFGFVGSRCIRTYLGLSEVGMPVEPNDFCSKAVKKKDEKTK